jgi:hypothetical protein
MMVLAISSVGLALAGPPGMVLAASVAALWGWRHRRVATPPFRSVLMLLLVELQSGQSALGALQNVSRAFPDHPQLVLGARVATLEGLTAAVTETSGEIRKVFSHLARSQRSGAPLVEAVRILIEGDIAREKSRRMERARSLPVRLMVPMALLLLPGLVLMLYAPALLRLVGEITRPFR